MTISRKDLYAFGEPFGNMATQNLPGSRLRTYGKGESSGPTNTKVENSNLPEYVRPYVESMLGSAQQQIYNFNPNGTVSGFKGYTPYSTNMNNYVAGFSPMQQQSFQGAANLQTPGQFGQASQMAGMAGLGSLQTAGQAGQAGNNYFGMATNPGATQAFMNPYLQSALNPALDETRRQYGINQTNQMSNATKAGAFGGSREALMASENNRNMNTAMNQMIGTGYQNAYTDAQRNILSGNQLGLQGQQAALQGYNQLGQAAGALGQLGQQQFGAQKDIIGMQNQYGAQQQAAEQQKINQAIQNYATAQQYPMMQLGNMSNLLRGLPMQSTTTQSYQAGPTGLNTLAGIGTGIAGAAQLMKAEGGTVKSYKGGGITSLANRQSIAEDLNPEQLEQVIKNGTIPPTIGRAIKEDNLRDSKAASMMAGIDTAPTNLPVVSAAQGGIISFSTGDVVQGMKMPEYGLKPEDLEKTDTTGLKDILSQFMNKDTNKAYTEEEIADKRRKKETSMGIKNLYPEREKEFEKTQADIEGQKNKALGFGLLGMSEKLFENANKPGLMAFGPGIGGFTGAYAPALKDIRANEANLRKDKFLAQDAQNAMLQAQMSGDEKAYTDARSAYNAAQTAIINAEGQDRQARNAVRGDEAKYKAELGGKIIAGVLDNMGKTDAASITSGSANKGHVASLLGSLTTDVNSARNSHNSNFKRDAYDEATTFIRENKGKKLDPQSKRTYDKYTAYVADYNTSLDNIKLIGQRYEPLLRQNAKAAGFSDEVIERLVAEAYNPNLNKPKTETTNASANKSGAKAADFDG